MRKSLENFLENYISEINQLKKNSEFRIFAGELNPYIYDNEKVLNSLEDAYKRNIKIDIIVGPFVWVKSSNITSRSFKIGNLAKKGILKIYMRSKSIYEYHFKIGKREDNSTYINAHHYHKPTLPLEDRETITNEELMNKKNCKNIEELSDLINLEYEKVLKSSIEVNGNYFENILLLYEEEINIINSIAEKYYGENIDKLDWEKIFEVILFGISRGEFRKFDLVQQPTAEYIQDFLFSGNRGLRNQKIDNYSYTLINELSSAFQLSNRDIYEMITFQGKSFV